MVHEHPLVVLYFALFILHLFSIMSTEQQDEFAKSPGVWTLTALISPSLVVALVWLVFSAAGRL